MRWIPYLTLTCASLFASIECSELPIATSQYLDLYKKYPKILGPTGSFQQGEIEVVLDLPKIVQIQEESYQRLLKKGISPQDAKTWTTIGIIAEDEYWIWIRDAVIFPSRSGGTYDRLLWKSSFEGHPGVAILAVLPNKKIVLNLNFRHATRSWELELPRERRLKSETSEAAALRGLHEETGYVMSKATYLGEMAVDSGVLNSLVPIFSGFVNERELQDADYSEAIEDILSFDIEQIKAGYLSGYIEVIVKGKTVKAFCRDPFLSFALFSSRNPRPSIDL